MKIRRLAYSTAFAAPAQAWAMGPVYFDLVSLLWIGVAYVIALGAAGAMAKESVKARIALALLTMLPPGCLAVSETQSWRAKQNAVAAATSNHPTTWGGAKFDAVDRRAAQDAGSEWKAPFRPQSAHPDRQNCSENWRRILKRPDNDSPRSGGEEPALLIGLAPGVDGDTIRNASILATKLSQSPEACAKTGLKWIESWLILRPGSARAHRELVATRTPACTIARSERAPALSARFELLLGEHTRMETLAQDSSSHEVELKSIRIVSRATRQVLAEDWLYFLDSPETARRFHCPNPLDQIASLVLDVFAYQSGDDGKDGI